MNTPETSRDYQRIEQALNFVAENFRQQPSLSEIAASVHLSEHHFQRLFQRWAGVSPKQFLQHLTLSSAAECLQAGFSTMEAAYEVG
ncbi:MAG: AraC family transcriptional regulator, partial [Pseudomonadota bacterium]